MDFETVNALRNLDHRTPDYLREEIFAHGDLTTRKHAIEALKTLDPECKSWRILIEMFQIG